MVAMLWFGQLMKLNTIKCLFVTINTDEAGDEFFVNVNTSEDVRTNTSEETVRYLRCFIKRVKVSLNQRPTITIETVANVFVSPESS